MSIKMEDLVKMKMYSKVLGWDEDEQNYTDVQKRQIAEAAFGGTDLKAANITREQYNDFKRAMGKGSTDMLSTLMCAQGNKGGCNVAMLNALGAGGGDSDLLKMLMLTQGR